MLDDVGPLNLLADISSNLMSFKQLATALAKKNIWVNTEGPLANTHHIHSRTQFIIKRT